MMFKAASEDALNRTVRIAKTELARQIHVSLACETLVQEPKSRIVFWQDHTVDDATDLTSRDGDLKSGIFK